MKLGARWSRMMLALAVISTFALSAVTTITHTQTAHACPTSPSSSRAATCATYNFPYAHSWYVTNPSQLASLASGDAQWSDATCANNPQIGNVDFLTVLDFGRPGLNNGTYSVYDLGGGWLSDTQVEQDAETYAQTWYNDTTGCPRLHLAIGTANDYECYNGSYNYSCSVYTAGQQWDVVAHTVASYVSSNGWSWQETIWSGDDAEGSWDQFTSCSTCYPKTVDFLNGFTNKESSYSSHLNLVDYGDAGYGQGNIQGGPLWTQQNVYDASWGIGWDVPLPELYVQGQFNAWLCVYNNNCGGGISEGQGQLQFYGEMTECSEADTLPTGNCWVQRSNMCQWSPYEAYNNLATAVNDPNISYSSNIRWPGDAASGNNGC